MTINSAQVSTAMKQRMATLNLGIPVGWPDRTFSPTGDHVVCDIAFGSKIRMTIAGKHHRMNGSMTSVVAVKSGGGTLAGENLAHQIVAHFPADLKLTLTGGQVLRVTADPDVKSGYPDAAYWRIPVQINFVVDD